MVVWISSEEVLMLVDLFVDSMVTADFIFSPSSSLVQGTTILLTLIANVPCFSLFLFSSTSFSSFSV